MNQASSGINLAWSEEFGFRLSEAQPDKMIVAKKKGNQRRKEQVFHGIEMGRSWVFKQKKPAYASFGEFS